MDQLSFSDLEYENKKRKTRRAQTDQEDRIAKAAERQADAAERTRESMRDMKVTKSGAIEVNLRTLGGEAGAPRFSQSDMSNLANQITPLIIKRIRQEQSRGP